MSHLYSKEIISSKEQTNNSSEIDAPNTSPSLIGKLNITNYQINGSRFYHNDVVPVEGKLYEESPPPPPYFNMSNYNVCVVLDGIQMLQFNDITDIYGNFRINFSVPYNWNIYSIHIIQVEVTDDIGDNIIEQLNKLVLFSNATSYFDIDSYNQNSPLLAGTNYRVPGYLRYDNGTVLSSESITYNWYNESSKPWASSNFNTAIDGSFPNNLATPIDDNSSEIIYLNLTYSGINNYVNGSKKIIPVNIYRNITCDWNTVGSATEGSSININGLIFTIDRRLKINFTEFSLRLGGNSIGNVTTDANGYFSTIYTIPGGTTGLYNLSVELFGNPLIKSNSTSTLSISTAPIVSGGGSISSDDDDPVPFLNFFMFFIPIVSGIVVIFVVYAYFYLKKQKTESFVVKIPLESRIRNLIILKDTGRMEESLSYLFQSIYMELIKAKYGKIKNINETIRDFAIISVRDLKLNPASIYPFIQKIEQIIYARPFIIKDKDFYEAVALFSPIYYELTGHTFVLNF